MSGDGFIDLHDSDIARMGEVIEVLHKRQSQGNVNLEAFRQEAIDRFAAVGFKVEVKAWETDQPGVFAFDMEVVERLAGEFDPDRQVAEATRDVLGLGEGGVIASGSPSASTNGHHAHGHHSHPH